MLQNIRLIHQLKNIKDWFYNCYNILRYNSKISANITCYPIRKYFDQNNLHNVEIFKVRVVSHHKRLK